MPWGLASGPTKAAALVGAAALVALPFWIGHGIRARSSAASTTAASLDSAPERASATPDADAGPRTASSSGNRAALGAACVVRAHVTRGRLGALAGAPVHARLYGYSPPDTVLLEEELTSDANGDVAWNLAPPMATVRVELVASPADHLPDTTGQLLARGTLAPHVLLLTCLPLDAELAGTVRGPAGTPVAGVIVSLGKERHVVSDADGRYRLRVASQQTEHSLYAAATTPLVAHLDLAPFRSGESRSLDVELVPGLVIQGNVRDERGAPVTDARVSGSFWLEYVGAPFGATTSDANGRFELVLEPDESYIQLTARHPGFAPTELEKALRRSDHPFGLDPQRIEVVLRTGAQASGRVSDPDGRPIEGALVYLSAFFHDNAVTDPDGRFTLASLPHGKVTLTALQPGRASRDVELDLTTRDAASDVEFVLTPGAPLTGRVRDGEDRPVPWAIVTCSPQRICADEEGRFVFESVPVTAKHVYVEAPGFANAELELDGAREDLVVRMAPSAALAGRVVDATTGAPIPRFTLRLLDPEENDHPEWMPSDWTDGIAQADPAGLWRLEAAFPPGREIGVEVRADGHAPALAAGLVTTLASDSEACVLRLVGSTRVFGQVVDAETGEPIAGARIERSTPGLQARDDPSTQTDAQGRFELRNVPTGPMSLMVRRITFADVLDGPFVVAGTVERRIELDHGATIVGQLLDPEGNPLADQDVLLRASTRNGPSNWTYRTDRDGRFRFANLPGADYTIAYEQRREVEAGTPTDSAALGTLSSLGYVQQLPNTSEAVSLDLVDAVRLLDHGTREIVLQAHGEAALSGTLAFDGELPEIVPVALVLLDDDGRPTPRARGTFAERGAFRFTHLAAGRYELRADVALSKDARAAGSETVEVPEFGEVRARLTLARP
jgi:hypothetical protein